MNNKRDIRWLQLSDLHMFEVTELGIFKEQLYDMFQKKLILLLLQEICINMEKVIN